MDIDILSYLDEASQLTIRMLSVVLPEIGGSKWWEKTVVAKLSYQQQQSINRNHTSNLKDLDIAVIMRVLGKNWHEVSAKVGLPDDAKQLVMQIAQIRSRMIQGKTPTNPDCSDLYSNLDNLSRYLRIFKASQSVLARIEADKEALRTLINSNQSESGTAPHDPHTNATGQKQAGVSLDLLKNASKSELIKKLLSEKTYIGIDFGTSTTTVSRVVIDEQTGSLAAEPIPISQFDITGACTQDHQLPQRKRRQIMKRPRTHLESVTSDNPFNRQKAACVMPPAP
ncbi:MAG: hypothetical protein PHN85_09020, partial [Kiritimatiellae bacterium]|nr:hypothetical protein [Kiritimatiellia bacterium]